MYVVREAAMSSVVKGGVVVGYGGWLFQLTVGRYLIFGLLK